MIEKLLYIILIFFAFIAIQTPKLRRAVVYLAVFSAISAFIYILMGAPDVALAEAVIGSTIATIIYLAALQKYRVFMIYFTDEQKTHHQDEHVSRKKDAILTTIEKFCFNRELEPQIIYTVENLITLKKKSGWDLIIRKKEKEILLYGNKRNYHAMALKEECNTKNKYKIKFIVEDIDEK